MLVVMRMRMLMGGWDGGLYRRFVGVGRARVRLMVVRLAARVEGRRG